MYLVPQYRIALNSKRLCLNKMYVSAMLIVWIFMLIHGVHGDGVDAWQSRLGSTLCSFTKALGKLSSTGGVETCPPLTCSPILPNSAYVRPRHVVLSYSHNGFGNQLWEHSFAQMVAQQIHAPLYITPIPATINVSGTMIRPPNTMDGHRSMLSFLPEEYDFDKLPATHPHAELCNSEAYILRVRPVDLRNASYSDSIAHNIRRLFTSSRPTCIKLLGYFQQWPLCLSELRRFWTSHMLSAYPLSPEPTDLSIYLRCLPRHYHFNSKVYYETLLHNIKFRRILLFMAPDCQLHTHTPRSTVDHVLHMLFYKYNATRWPAYAGGDEGSALLHDLAGLIRSNKLILSASSWAQWAGMLSNASEIHVSRPHHPVMPSQPQYVYHSERENNYFGKYNPALGIVRYTKHAVKEEAAIAYSIPAGAEVRRTLNSNVDHS